MENDLAQGDSTGGLFSGYSKKFSDPFILPSSSVMPTTMETAMDMCLFLYFMNPQYRRGVIRLISHFITRIDFKGEDGDQKERDELEDFLVNGIDIKGALHAAGEEYGAFGNGFFRMSFPFDRFLVDRRSGKMKLYSLDLFKDKAKYQWSELTYEVPDPTQMNADGTSKQEIRLPFIDRPSNDMSRMAIRKLDPRRVGLQHSWISGKTRVIYRFEEWFIKTIKDGFRWQVDETPISMLRAIKDNEDFLFNEDEVFHFKAPTISGISNNGWGLPETIANFRALHQVQVYRKIDEAVGMDYMVPMRMFTPAIDAAGNSGDYFNMATWSQFMAEIIDQRRKDPFTMHAMPFDTKYQESGGNGKGVTPWENMKYADEQLQEAMGIPAELWRGSLAVQEIPTTLRLFENTFHFIFRGFDSMLRWIVRRLLERLGREQMQVGLQLPSMADDLEERNIYLQLAAGGEISRRKAYRPFGVEDPIQEARARMQEDIEIQREQQKLQAQEQRRQQLGSVDQVINGQQQMQGGAAGQAPGGAQTTPLQVQQDAQDLAQKWLQIQSNGERSKQMQQTKASNPNLYASAKQALEEMKAQGASQGRQQVSQQAQQPGQ